MASNKKHHYVAQFHLRHFSPQNYCECVNVFNISRGKHIKNAGISGQCYKNYFYGKDPSLENLLCVLEGRAAAIFKAAVDMRRLPPRLTFEQRKLVDFIAVQLARTDAAGNEYNEVVDKLAKYMLSVQKPDLCTDNVKIGVKHPTSRGLINALIMSPILHDLDYILVEAAKGEFVISDDPIVQFNCIIDHRRFVDGIGLGAAGLAINIPISPRFSMLFFDDSRYRVSGKRLVGGVVSAQEDDVRQLNSMQYMNASANLYYRSDSAIRGIDEMHRAFSNSRRKIGDIFSSETVENTNTKRRDIVCVTKRRISFMPDLRLLSVKRPLLPWENRERDPVWVTIVTDYIRSLDGEDPTRDFYNFLTAHHLAHKIKWMDRILSKRQ